MEELKMAINAMKSAEESLAKQGFILRWKVRVKIDQDIFPQKNSNPVDTKQESEKEKIIKAAPLPKDKNQKEAKAISEIPEEINEERPVTALDINSAASYLGVTLTGMYNLIKRGRIKAHGKLGRRWYKIEELDQYRAEREKRNAR